MNRDVGASEATVDVRRYVAALEEGSLIFQRCNSCNTATFPPRVLCPSCLADALVWETSGGLGEIYTFTVLPGDAGGRDVVLAAIHLSEGFSMISRIVGESAASASIGARVAMRIVSVDGRILPLFALEGEPC